MSTEKRQQLIEMGLLHEDGSRKEVCSCCGQPLTPEIVAAMRAAEGSAVGEAAAVEAGVTDPNQEGAP